MHIFSSIADRAPLIHDHETGLTAGVIDQQGMLTPPRHLIPLPGIRVSPFISLICNFYLCFEIDHSFH